MQSTKISGNQILGRSDAPQITAEAKGSWNGISVQIRQVKDVDAEIRKAQYRQETGLDAPSDHKTLHERVASLDVRSLALTPESLSKLAKVFGGEAKATRLAQAYLNYLRGQQERPKQDGSLNNLLQHYIALHKLSEALKGSDADLVARLTPNESGNGSLSELADRLVEAGDDPEKLLEALGEVDLPEEESEKLATLMKTLRFQPDELKRKLRDVQQLPELDDEEKDALREQVEDVLLQLEIDDGSRIKAARNGIEKGFETSDPEGFVESYSSALESTGSFLKTFIALVKRHTPNELRHVIPLMKQTLADELQLDQHERSADKIKLESLMNELSYMHISTTLIEKINKLVEGMQRIYATPSQLELDEQKLLLGLLRILSDGWVSPTHFDRLVNEHHITDGAPAIYFLTGIQQILRELPFKVYQDDNSRSAIIDAAQAALDSAIAREEALPNEEQTEPHTAEVIQRGMP